MKRLSTDTLQELQLLPQRAGDKSIFSLINRTHTYGGRDALEKLLASPFATLPQIQHQQQLFKFVSANLDALTIEIAHAYLIAAENHLSSNLAWSSAKSWLKRYRQALWFSWFQPHDFNRLHGGTAAIQLVLRTIKQKTAWLAESTQLPPELQQYTVTLQAFFDHPDSKDALRKSDKPAAIMRADFLLRHKWADTVRAIFTVFYQLDAYTAIARFTEGAAWTYPEFVESEKPTFQAISLTHPLLNQEHSVGNDFSLISPHSLTLLTGGNMSGKTTFLKACGIAIYLAHLGMPVPAQSLRISFFDCLLTSIHLSDNLELGYSHFYTELMRIKSVADALASKQRVFLIADELFRGTNPQDALVCSHLVIDKLILQSNSLFMISSHLPEIGTPYQENAKVQFNCFKTQVLDGKLVHLHKISSGLANERTGLLLLQQTGTLAALQ